MGTTDIWFASFLIQQGYVVSSFNVISKGKGEYFFDIDSDKWKEERIKFSTSEASKLKLIQISLKDLIH